MELAHQSEGAGLARPSQRTDASRRQREPPPVVDLRGKADLSFPKAAGRKRLPMVSSCAIERQLTRRSGRMAALLR